MLPNKKRKNTQPLQVRNPVVFDPHLTLLQRQPVEVDHYLLLVLEKRTHPDVKRVATYLEHLP